MSRWLLAERRGAADAHRVLGLAVLLLGAACVDTQFADAQFLCDPAAPNEGCPDGQRCSADGVCRSDGAGGSATGGSAAGGSGGVGGVGASGGGGAGGTSTGAGGGDGGSGGEWIPGWASRWKLSFNNLEGAEPLVDFPVPIIVTAHDLGLLGSADGQDVRFFDAYQDADQAIPLSHEIEQTGPNVESVFWVRVPQIDAGSNGDSIWLYAANPAPDAPPSPELVWSNGYRAVWHLNEDQTTPTTHGDSTGHGNGGQPGGNARAQDTTAADGLSLAGVQRFVASEDDKVSVGPTANLQQSYPSVTIEARVKSSTASTQYPHVLGAGDDGQSWQIWGSGGFWNGRGSVMGATDPIPLSAGCSPSVATDWATLALVYDGQHALLYCKDGDPGISSQAQGGPIIGPGDHPIVFGNNPVLDPDIRRFNGWIDEVRISDVLRSADWLRAQRAAQNRTFVSYGDIEHP